MRFIVVRTFDSWQVIDTHANEVMLEVNVWRKNVAQADADARNAADDPACASDVTIYGAGSQ